jgi:hypothetical protein
VSEKYGEDQPWHLTQEPDVAPSYEELEEVIKELTKELSEANKRGDAWRFRADIEEAKLAKAVEALERAKASIENGGGGGVTDVVWLDDPCPETLCDFIAATIAEIKGEANGQAPHAG